ncbi:MAG TPA: hypothetical protein VKT27_05840 [Candidatus Binataceae bacterium]|nr:hypothetical protein [Candidatus Binataceae bacterium]
MIKTAGNGQAMAEFMIAMIPAVIILFVAIQFAVVARDGTALGQFASQMARWAAAPSNSGADAQALVSYVQSNTKVMPLPVAMIVNANGISYSGSASPTPNGVTIAMNCPGVTDCTKRVQGSQVQVVVTMSITKDLFLGQTFLGIGFPSSLSNQSSAFTQG